MSVEINIQRYSQINNILDDNIYFMNHGYHPLNKKIEGLGLVQESQANLYYKCIDNLDLSGKRVLDIGCGRGGGTLVYKSLFPDAEIHGCDVNPDLMEFCKRSIPGVSFETCRSDELKYEDGYFDVVTNVESLHTYPDPDKFYSEVKRVLKPGGIFVCTDGRLNNKLTQYLSDNFETIECYDITDNVAMASLHDIDKYKKLGQKFLYDIAVDVYPRYKNRQYEFWIYIGYSR